jgi:hypothetical protein
LCRFFSIFIRYYYYTYRNIIDWLVFNVNFSIISAISLCYHTLTFVLSHSDLCVISSHSDLCVISSHYDLCVISSHSDLCVISSHSVLCVISSHSDLCVISSHSDLCVISSHSDLWLLNINKCSMFFAVFKPFQIFFFWKIQNWFIQDVCKFARQYTWYMVFLFFKLNDIWSLWKFKQILSK